MARQRDKLACFVSKYDANIVLLSETQLCLDNHFSLPTYAMYCTIRIVLAYAFITQTSAHSTTPPPPEATLVTINVADTELQLVSVYKKISPVTLRKDLLPTVAFRDMNCKHISWVNAVTELTRRHTLYHYDLTRLDVLVISPNSLIHIPSQDAFQADILDIVIVKNVVRSIQVEAI